MLLRHEDWCRHSLCSIEGDILISNIDGFRSDSSEYLIPSLLVLKKKVDKVFGSQKVVSLSEDRPNVSELTCCSESGQKQFQLFAETVLKQKGGIVKQAEEPKQPMELISPVDSTVSSLEFSVNEEELLLFLTEEEQKDIQACQLQPQPLQQSEGSEIHSSTLLSFISQYEKPVEAQPVNLLEKQGCVMNQYSYTLQPPSRLLEDHAKTMKANGVELYHYDTVVCKKEFEPVQFLNTCTLIDKQPVDQSNRILFWKEILKDQMDLEYVLSCEVTCRDHLVFNSYSYQVQPPRISLGKKTESAPSSISFSAFEDQFFLSSSASQSSSSLVHATSLPLHISRISDCFHLSCLQSQKTRRSQIPKYTKSLPSSMPFQSRGSAFID